MPIFNESGESVAPVADLLPHGADQGEKEQDVAEPAINAGEGESNDSQGEKEQDAAEPAEETGKDDIDSAEANGEATMTDGKPQSKTKNREFAAKRRQRELDDAIKAAKNEATKAFGIINPATGKPFDDYDALIKYRKGQDMSRAEEKLRAAGIDPELIKSLISDNPAVIAANAALERAEAAEQTANEKANSLTFDNALLEITKKDASIKSYADLAAIPEYDKFKKLVNAGFGFGEAFDMATVGRTAKAERQAAYNSVASKSHLTSTKGRVMPDNGITDKQYGEYKQLFPNATRAEAAAAYKKFGGK